MLDSELFQKTAEAVLASQKLHLYDLHIGKSAGSLTVAITIDETLDLDHIAEVSELLSKAFDQVDKSDVAYVLDVSCAGIERAIPLDKLQEALGKYIHIDLKDHQSHEGILEDSDAETITLKVKQKQHFQSLTLKVEDTLNIRYAVQF